MDPGGGGGGADLPLGPEVVDEGKGGPLEGAGGNFGVAPPCPAAPCCPGPPGPGVEAGRPPPGPC